MTGWTSLPSSTEPRPFAERQALIESWLDSLARPYSAERSVKCAPARWAHQRRLYSVPLDGVDADDLAVRLEGLLESLALAPGDRRAFVAGLSTQTMAHYLHLGLEAATTKVYWEAPLPDKALPGRRFPLYQAWKWRPGVDASVSDYVLLESAEAVRHAMASTLAAMPPLVGDVIEQLEVSHALARKPWPPLTVRIEERRQGRDTGRDSINLHLHPAEIRLGELAGLLLSLAREWRCTSRAQAIEWIAAHGDKPLSNLSLGFDAKGEPFVTFYHGVTLVSPTSTGALAAQRR